MQYFFKILSLQSQNFEWEVNFFFEVVDLQRLLYTDQNTSKQMFKKRLDLKKFCFGLINQFCG